jgi:peptidoglycan/LPS O-acetylase OafA/YrhL
LEALPHQTALITVQRLTYSHPVPQATLSLLIATGIAWGIYQLIERPCAKLRRQLR